MKFFIFAITLLGSMSFLPGVSAAGDIDIVTFSILSSGKEIPDVYQVESIRIDQQINKIAEAEIVLIDGSVPEENFKISEASIFKPGVVIEIKLGYDGRNNSVFKGIITRHGIETDEDGSRLYVICQDAAIKMAVKRKTKRYTESKVSDVINQISSSYGIDTEIAATNAVHLTLLQDDLTDWEFIVDQVRRAGMLVVTDSGKLNIATPAVNNKPALQLTYGDNIISSDLEMNAIGQYSGVEVNAIDASSGKAIKATAREPSVNQQGNLTGKTLARVANAGAININTQQHTNPDVIQTWADSELLASRMSRFRGTITFQGASTAKINTIIHLKGLGSRFSGNAFVSGIAHKVEYGNWISEAYIGY